MRPNLRKCNIFDVFGGWRRAPGQIISDHVKRSFSKDGLARKLVYTSSGGVRRSWGGVEGRGSDVACMGVEVFVSLQSCEG
jgi:hypothetical protein